MPAQHASSAADTSSPPQWILALLFLLQGLAVNVPSCAFVAFALAASLSTWAYFQCYPPSGPVIQVAAFGYMVSCLGIKTINVVFFRKPEELQRLPEKRSDAVTSTVKNGRAPVDVKAFRRTKPDQRSWKAWVADVIELPLTTRGIGWKLQVRKLPPCKPKGYSKWAFVSENLRVAVASFLALDLATFIMRSTSAGEFPITYSMSDHPLPQALLMGGLICLMGKWGLESTYRSLAAVAVTLGWGDPSYWPPLFGLWRDAYTVRRFWSRTWHQMMRLVAEPPTYFLLHDVLKIKRGTYFSNYGKVFGAFFVAYIVHVAGNTMTGTDCVGDFVFFMSQAAAIWFEEAVVDIYLRSGLSLDPRIARATGYSWTLLFVSWTWVRWSDNIVAVGLWKDDAGGIFENLWMANRAWIISYLG